MNLIKYLVSVTSTPTPTPPLGGEMTGSILDAVRGAIHRILTGETSAPPEAASEAVEVIKSFGNSVKEIAQNFDSVFQIFFPFLDNGARAFIYFVISLWALFLISKVANAIVSAFTGGIL